MNGNTAKDPDTDPYSDVVGPCLTWDWVFQRIHRPWLIIMERMKIYHLPDSPTVDIKPAACIKIIASLAPRINLVCLQQLCAGLDSNSHVIFVLQNWGHVKLKCNGSCTSTLHSCRETWNFKRMRLFRDMSVYGSTSKACWRALLSYKSHGESWNFVS